MVSYVSFRLDGNLCRDERFFALARNDNKLGDLYLEPFDRDAQGKLSERSWPNRTTTHPGEPVLSEFCTGITCRGIKENQDAL